MSIRDRSRLFAKNTFRWGRANFRKFPWRTTNDPYRILVTEQLLRKTTAKQVRDIYENFFLAFPTFQALAESSNDRIRGLISSLGLQDQRSELLHKVAAELVKHGGIPRDEIKLLDLPGVGQYGADAVRCLAFDETVPMVDRNVVRVVGRIFSDFSQETSQWSDRRNQSIRKFLHGLIPAGKAKSFNFALLDFAALVCKAQRPLCSSCPQSSICDYWAGAIARRRAGSRKRLS